MLDRTATYIKTSSLALLTASALSGCYVEVAYEQEADFNTDVNYYLDILDMETSHLVNAALVPAALAAETPYMVIDPDAFTTPQSRNLSRAIVIETTYAYLFDNEYCPYGGYTSNEVEAETTSYDDGYTFVELTLDAKAYDCNLYSAGTYMEIDSDLFFNVEGWYDDWLNQLDSVNALITGDIRVEYNDKIFVHDNLLLDVIETSPTGISIEGDSKLTLVDYYDIEYADMTFNNVLWSIGTSAPYSGTVLIEDGFDWVELEFSDSGVTRIDSSGYVRFWYWGELNY